MKIVLISTYDMGRQPFGLASPAAFLRAEGAEVTCLDLAVEPLDDARIEAAGLVAFHLPMHTATRIAARVMPRVRQINPRAHICFYGLYAPPNQRFLRSLGGETILGGEFEEALANVARRLARGEAVPPEDAPRVSTGRQEFRVPERDDLPPLARYARLRLPTGDERLTGYTEASRGCRHLCRHCPVVPIYKGRFRVVPKEIVLEDIRRQVAAGAQHITFGDPDFLNGPTHAMAIASSMHTEHPGLTFDITAKVEHLIRNERALERLKSCGCLFITSAAESVDDRVLWLLKKGHTRADFVRAVAACRRVGLTLHPTFIPFTPWTTLRGYAELLEMIEELDIVEEVAPVQLPLRLLIQGGSALLDLPDVRGLAGPFDEALLVHPWRHADPLVDRLQARIEAMVRDAVDERLSRAVIFARAIALAGGKARRVRQTRPEAPAVAARAAVPYLTEPWFC